MWARATLKQNQANKRDFFLVPAFGSNKGKQENPAGTRPKGEIGGKKKKKKEKRGGKRKERAERKGKKEKRRKRETYFSFISLSFC